MSFEGSVVDYPGNQIVEMSDVAGFAEIVQGGLDPAYESSPAPLEIVPFGPFTPADEAQLNDQRAALASSTGYTGNNTEESN